MVEPDIPQMTIIRRIRVTCWVPKATDTLRICNTCCFSAAAVVRRTRLSVTVYVLCLSGFFHLRDSRDKQTALSLVTLFVTAG